MQQNYRNHAQLQGEKKSTAITSFLASLREKIEQTNLSENFKKELKAKMEEIFGKDGSYAVFVRSDTNVEDLPGFTGAGLNLTVPNVVGFDEVTDAILRVWASPFTERAYAWRQGRMPYPEYVYPSIILTKTVPVEKSGVLITQDTETGDPQWLSLAVNHGLGGAVQGQAAEELRVKYGTGEIRLLADATSPSMRIADRLGGLKTLPVPGSGIVLESAEIQQLVQLAKQINENFPQYDTSGHQSAADIEFGFEKGLLRLFQVRPYSRSQRARNNQYLISLDRGLKERAQQSVKLTEVPL
jgi:phosphoenolpyruvate synthase/pyruvate phosphate dikinase